MWANVTRFALIRAATPICNVVILPLVITKPRGCHGLFAAMIVRNAVRIILPFSPPRLIPFFLPTGYTLSSTAIGVTVGGSIGLFLLCVVAPILCCVALCIRRRRMAHHYYHIPPQNPQYCPHPPHNNFNQPPPQYALRQPVETTPIVTYPPQGTTTPYQPNVSNYK